MPEEVEFLAARRELFESAFLGQAVYWWAKDTHERMILASKVGDLTKPLAQFRWNELIAIEDESEFQLKIITGEFDP